MAIHPNNCLFLVDQNGLIFYYNLESKQFETLIDQTVSTTSTSDKIHEEQDNQILFKCVSSCKNSLWAVSCDHRVYLFVFSLTNKIVEKFDFYENQRWNFINGFSDKLLPTDRPKFSNYEGTQSTPKDSFQLPSNNWRWKDKDWSIDDWLYAPDFSLDKQFTTEKTILSMVRKRRYTRTAEFFKFDQWIEIDSIDTEDKYQDPILDLAIGGQDALKDSNSINKLDVEQQNRNQLAVWCITCSGKIYFRKGVYNSRPEGSKWIEIPFDNVLNSTCDYQDSDNEQEQIKIEEITKIAVNALGNVWCLTSCGRCLVRLGVTRDNLIGISWVIVDPPFNSELSQISVGQDSVWAINKENELFFRKGISSRYSNDNLVCATGSTWIKLVNHMSYVSVNRFDQVWALSVDKKSLYFRMGVLEGELTGRMWKLIAKIQDTDNLISKENESENGSLNDLTIRSDLSSNSNDFISTSSSVAYLANQITNSWRCLETSSSVVVNDSFFKANNYLFQKKNHYQFKTTESIYEDDLQTGSIDSGSITLDNWKSSIVNQLYERFENEMEPFKAKYNTNENGSWLKTASVNFMYNETKIKDLINSNLELNNLQTNFFNSVNSYLYSMNSIVGPNFERNDFIKCHLELTRIGSTFNNTETGTLTFKYIKDHKRNKKIHKTNVINLAEIICITSSSNIINYPLPNILFIYLAKYIFVFSFEEESELNDWFALLNISCNCLNNLNDVVFSPFIKPTLFLISIFGQAYAGYLLSDRNVMLKRNKLKSRLDEIKSKKQNLKYKLHKLKELDKLNKDENSTTDELNGLSENDIEQILNELDTEENESKKSLEDLLIKSSHCTDQNERLYFMHLGGGNFKEIQFTQTGCVWGIQENGTPLIHTNSIGGSVYKNYLSNNNLNFITDTILYETYENQRFLPFVGFSDKLLPSDRYQWSDEAGLIELKKEDIKLQSSEWHWLNQWQYYCDRTTDDDGWQYSIDFQVEFHNQKKITDLVRRRKWVRLAKLETNGPWKQLSDETPNSLKSISMYETNCDDENKKSEIILWAINSEGDAMIRTGVSQENKQGVNWEYVDCREKLKSVTISGQLIKDNDHFIQVWCVALDGSAYLRHDVTLENHKGVLWFHIEPYSLNSPINRLFSCPSNCFMIDDKLNFYFRDKIKREFPEGIAWRKFNKNFYILQAAFPSNDGNKCWALIEVHDKQSRNLELVVCQNFSTEYNLTESYDFKWKARIKNAFKYIAC